MQIDQSETRLGRPGDHIEWITGRLGGMAAHGRRLRFGITPEPWIMLQRLTGKDGQAEIEMKVLWASHSLDQARQMAELLRAWDPERFTPDPVLMPHNIDPASTYYLFAALG